MILTNFHDLLSRIARTNPAAPALTYKGETVGYAEAWGQTCAVASLLADLGLQRGDRVAIYLEKRIETVLAMFAVSLAGGVFVPINPVLKAAQVGHILGDSGARVFVTSLARLRQVVPVVPGTEVTDVVLVGGRADDNLDGLTLHDWPQDPLPPKGAECQEQDPPSRLRGWAVIDIDPAGILYTSGSTGKPKGVVLSHRNLLVGAQSVSTYLKNTGDDVILSVLPLSFDAGLSQITTAFAVGAHCVLMNYLVARDVPKLCQRHGVTGLTCVPPLWLQLAEVEWPDEVARRLRYWANTGGRMPRNTLDRLRGIFTEADAYLMYGLTEAFRSTYLDPTEVDRRPDSIGKAIPNAEVLVLHPDGTPCEPGETGELVHRGALVSLGYWNDPARTAERFRPVPTTDGTWRLPELAVWSGDTVVADEQGFLYFVGRTDEMIKTSGYRVSPTEIEEAAYATGLVRDAVAFGLEDVALGQQIVLAVTPIGEDLTAESLLGALRQALPLYMVPTRVEVLADLPRSPNNKYDRPAIKAELS